MPVEVVRSRIPRKRRTAAAVARERRTLVTVLPREHYGLPPVTVARPDPAAREDWTPTQPISVKSRPRVWNIPRGTAKISNVVSGTTHVRWSSLEGTVGPVKSREEARKRGLLGVHLPPKLADRS